VSSPATRPKSSKMRSSTRRKPGTEAIFGQTNPNQKTRCGPKRVAPFALWGQTLVCNRCPYRLERSRRSLDPKSANLTYRGPRPHTPCGFPFTPIRPELIRLALGTELAAIDMARE
jgi:hypothetical protein